jgi:MoaA/NifB/PqqE/SkfB family radical SAM enzyme
VLAETLRAIGDLLTPFHLDWIQIEVSSRCNGRCCYCPVGHFRGRRRDILMPMEVFERLEPFFPSADLIFLQGWGEPLLHPRFWEMVHRARQAGCRVGFTTSGVLLNEGNRQALLDSGMDVMGVSVAGATPATHDRFRAGDPLEVVDLQLRRLRKEKGDASVRLPEVHMAYLLLAANIDEIELAVDRAEVWGATEIVVSHLSLIINPSLEAESFLARPDEWPRAQEQLRAAQSRARERGIRLVYRSPARHGAMGDCGENALRSCFVSALGDVSPCVLANVGSARGAVHRFDGRGEPLLTLVFGNVGHRSLEEIWRGDAARHFRTTFGAQLSRRRSVAEGWPVPCKNCYKLRESVVAPD